MFIFIPKTKSFVVLFFTQNPANAVINYSPSSSEHKLRYLWNPRAFWPYIDINATDTIKSQKGSKDIIKIVLVTAVVQP